MEERRLAAETEFRATTAFTAPLGAGSPAVPASLWSVMLTTLPCDAPHRPDTDCVDGVLSVLRGGCRDQVVGHNCRFMQGPQTDKAELVRLKEGMAEQRPVTVRLLNYRQDGSKFWNNLHVAPIRNADGEVHTPLPDVLWGSLKELCSTHSSAAFLHI